MKLISRVLQLANGGLSYRFQAPIIRTLSTNSFFSATRDTQKSSTFESDEDFQRRILGGPENDSNPLFRKLDRIDKAHERYGYGSRFNPGNRSEALDGWDESVNTLSDGMDWKLTNAATSFTIEDEEVNQDDYSFRPDMDIKPGMVLDTKDLDLRKPAVPRPPRRPEFETTTEEVLQKADFRNVRFLANFITEAGIIIKRSKTGISAKAQRKIAREIKTARAFGLLPFTTMGTKQFIFGKTMEDCDEDFQYETYYSHDFVDENPREGPIKS
ncbi:hypothetical protein M9H77_05939 [Catharanthus roseus]|uniref:Uncharacterized protein n=1 Tax=Catharanthus roseus TaxID=4058 RepID=A0ACC0BQQ1_CATRO|nr:hypothetical protein M9H77_05939 [Catharanthus roseus]